MNYGVFHVVTSPASWIARLSALTSAVGYTRAIGEQVSYIQKRSESGHGVARHPGHATGSPAPAHGPEAVHSLAVADRLAAVWVACQEDELATE